MELPPAFLTVEEGKFAGGVEASPPLSPTRSRPTPPSHSDALHRLLPSSGDLICGVRPQRAFMSTTKSPAVALDYKIANKQIFLRALRGRGSRYSADLLGFCTYSCLRGTDLVGHVFRYSEAAISCSQVQIFRELPM